jgi:hypothetical protein
MASRNGVAIMSEKPKAIIVVCLNSLRFFLRIYFPANRLEALWKRIDA